ncbi:MFS transporter [Nesterenkonia lutea]|uniref:MFS family permease n=1 Tax=Nesterenkonia lutea TaxID=272919 RepID=A0ABR9JE13_9MICC|nr:MFS transporter [Nesterenkonia lutea]MBE1524008.1 MFS family permease [Nesterenkonia lutea]
MSRHTPPPGPEGAGEGEDGSSNLFSRSFLLAIGINLCFGMVFFMLVTGMAVYAAAEFSIGQTAAGFAASAFVVGALLARIFAGKYVDFLGRRRTVLVTLVVYVLASVAYLVVDSYEVLILVRMLQGAAFGFGQTALNAGVFSLIPPARRGEGAGYYLVANSLPQALGPLVGIQISQTFGFGALFVSASILAVLALLLALGIRLPEARPPAQSLRQRLMLRPRDVIERRAIPVALVGMMLSVGFASVITFLDSFTRGEQMTNVGSLYFVIFATVVLITRLFVGRLHDRYGDNAVIYPTVVMFFGAMVLLSWSPNEAVVLGSAVLAGFGHGSLMPVLQATIASAVPAHRVSIGLSTFFIFMDSGVGLSPLLLGPLAEAGGYRFMYGACAGLILAAMVVYWLLHGRFDIRQGTPRRPRP